MEPVRPKSHKFELLLHDRAYVVACGRDIIDLTVAKEFQAVLDEAVAAGGAVLVDLAQVTYVDSVIISVLVKKHVSMRQEGRRLILFNLQGYVEELLRSTGLLGVMDIKSDLAAALALVAKPVPPEEVATYARGEPDA